MWGPFRKTFEGVGEGGFSRTPNFALKNKEKIEIRGGEKKKQFVRRTKEKEGGGKKTGCGRLGKKKQKAKSGLR